MQPRGRWTLFVDVDGRQGWWALMVVGPPYPFVDGGEDLTCSQGGVGHPWWWALVAVG